jgi:hypothetical protein
MTTLTAATTFSIGASTTVVESAQTTILPVIASGTGRGRLVHPTLGTYDYEQMPDEWVNVDGDVLIAPIWSSVRTLDGDANTLWQGDIRDVEVEEHWTFAVTATHMRAIDCRSGRTRPTLTMATSPGIRTMPAMATT